MSVSGVLYVHAMKSFYCPASEEIRKSLIP